jgi:outer membrane protein
LLSEYFLKFQIGMNINTKIVLTDSLNASEIKNISVSAEKNDVTNRVEYSLLQTQLHLLQLDLSRNRSQYLPNLVLYGNVSTVAQRPEFNIFDTDKRWYPTAFVGATFTLPIFSGLQKHYRVNQAQLSIRKLKNEMDNTVNGLNLEVISGRTALENATVTLTTQEKNLELANEVSKVSKLKYDQGVGSNLEVIVAETSLKEAQINYYNALYDALVAKVDLDKALGNIK